MANRSESDRMEEYRCRWRPLAKRANQEARESWIKGAPELTCYSSVEAIAAWLDWNDPNGVHTAEDRIAEGFETYTIYSAWNALASILEG